MALSQKLSRYGNSALRIGIPLILVLGVLLRLVLFFQNRNLIIDEANIVRNLSERSFSRLALPLSYQQYAPPVFLWIEKLASILFGYGEKTMRLYPLLCGLGSLLLFYKIACRLMRREGLWFPLALCSLGLIFVEYSATLKQYMPDTFIALLLVWLALRWDISSMNKRAFALWWILAGSIAIWSSMPSVFILAGIGGYYLWTVILEKRYRDIALLSAIGLVWFAQFILYYLAILKPQIGSVYLQNYHHEYFLFALPKSSTDWRHNWERIEEILGYMGGWTTVAVVFHILLLVVGIITLLRKHINWSLLLIVPALLVFTAAALQQFSLIARVVLFLMPILLLIIRIGYDTLWRLPLPVKSLVVVISLFIVISNSALKFLWKKHGEHEITEGMAYIRSKGAEGQQVYVHNNSVPTYIYYTELHPDKAQWTSLQGGHRLAWDDDYTEVTKGVKDTAYFIYTGGFEQDEREKRTSQIEVNMKQVSYFEKYVCYVYAYVPK